MKRFNREKCAQRRSVAARRGSVTAAPMRFLSGTPAPLAKTLATKGSLPATPAEALASINLLRPDQESEAMTSAQVFIHYMEAANNNYIEDRFMFLGETTLKNVAADAERGFAFMNSHRTGDVSVPAELPYGRTFAGLYEMADAEEGTQVHRAVVGFYMMAGTLPNGTAGPSTDDLHKAINGATLFDVSVGLYGGSNNCDIDGYDLNEFDSETGGYLCPHIPGSHVGMTPEQIAAQIARGVPDGYMTYTLNDAHCAETSAVYDGAVPGAGFQKAYGALKHHLIESEELSQIVERLSAIMTSDDVFRKPARQTSETLPLPLFQNTNVSRETVAQPREETPMYDATLRLSLGLTADAPDAEVTAHILGMKARADGFKVYATGNSALTEAERFALGAGPIVEMKATKQCSCCNSDTSNCGCASKDGLNCSCHSDCANCKDNSCGGASAKSNNSSREMREETETTPMYSNELKLKLGLSADATDEQVTAHITNLHAENGTLKTSSAAAEVTAKVTAGKLFTTEWTGKLPADVIADLVSLPNRETLAAKWAAMPGVEQLSKPPIGGADRQAGLAGTSSATAAASRSNGAVLSAAASEIRAEMGVFESDEKLAAAIVIPPETVLNHMFSMTGHEKLRQSRDSKAQLQHRVNALAAVANQ